MWIQPSTYSADDVADVIIEHCSDMDYPCSNLYLQKYLYFLQMSFVCLEHRELFNDYVTAGDGGCYCLQPQTRFFRYHGENIDRQQRYAVGKPLHGSSISAKDKHKIKRCIDELSHLSWTQLRDNNCSQQCWQNAYYSMTGIVTPASMAREYISQ